MGSGERGKLQSNGVLNSNTIQSLMDKTSTKKDQTNNATSGKE